MSISSRITSIEEHIGNAYKKIDDLGIDLSNVDKNIDNIASLLDTVYQDYPKVTGTGTEVTLDGTKVGKLGLDVKGNSTQDGTPAPDNEVPILSAGDDINQFDKDNANIINAYINNGTITEASNGKSLYISCKPNMPYIISRTAGTRFRVVDTSVIPAVGVVGSNYVGADTSSSITITTSANAKYLCVNYYNRNTDGANEQAILDSIKIAEGSTVTPYSPYNMGTISEKIVNKNWFDKNDFAYIDGKRLDDNGNIVNDVDSSYSTTLYRILPNSTYDIQGTQSITGKTTRIYYYDKNKTFLSRSSSYATDSYSFTTPSNCYYIGLQLRNSTYINKDIIQIELGSTVTTYTAHQEQTYTIPVQQPMRSIGDVRDEFIQDIEGNYFERHNLKYFLFKGSNDETWNMNYGDNLFTIPSSYITATYRAITGSGLSNYYQYDNRQYGMANLPNGKFAIQVYAGGTAFFVKNTDCATVEEFKTWLSTHNTEIIYPLETPVDLPCTEEQISILENLPKSYNEQTNIYSLDVTPAYVEAKALKGE